MKSGNTQVHSVLVLAFPIPLTLSPKKTYFSLVEIGTFLCQYFDIREENE
jgi:hypothetical protein